MVLFGGCASFYSGDHAWFYLGDVHGFIWGACMVFPGVCVFFSVFSDTMRYGQ